MPRLNGGIAPDEAAVPETWRAAGYATFCVGKWHNPPTPQTVPSAPRHTWPTNRGFDAFYGFMEGEAHFFFPAHLMQGTDVVPVDEYPRDYYTTDDWTHRSIRFIKDLRASAPDKPFLLHLAHNTAHLKPDYTAGGARAVGQLMTTLAADHRPTGDGTFTFNLTSASGEPVSVVRDPATVARPKLAS